MENKPSLSEQRKDRNVVKTTRRNLGIINGHLRGRLIYPKYGGGSGNLKQDDWPWKALLRQAVVSITTEKLRAENPCDAPGPHCPDGSCCASK